MNRRSFFKRIIFPLLSFPTAAIASFYKIKNTNSPHSIAGINNIEDHDTNVNNAINIMYDAGDIAFNPEKLYSRNSVGRYLTVIPGADNKGTKNSLQAFNNAILYLAKEGGGILRPEPGTYLIIGGSILLPSNIILELYGCHLLGDSKNTIIMAGVVIGTTLKEIVTEYGTKNTGNGEHFVGSAGIRGGTLSRAAVGVRAHRFNYGTTIEYVKFDNDLGASLISSHSWGLKFSNNTVLSPAIMKDFVDWTEISGNNFEGNSKYDDGYIGLTISTDGYGGSYSARIINNGFHRMQQGISIECESTNMIIESNHFEAVINHIIGSKFLIRNFRIKNNWMKANLTKFNGGNLVVPMSFGSLINSEIGPNFFTSDGQSFFKKHIVANSSDCYGNIYMIGYSNEDVNQFSLLSLSDTNQVLLMNGGNDSRTAQPCIDIRSGSGRFTFEKYKSSYNKVKNKVPFCHVEYSNEMTVVKTWMVWKNGCSSFCAFDFSISSSIETFRIAGTFCLDSISFTVNKSLDNQNTKIDINLQSSDDGFVVIRFPGVFNVTGWVKEL